MTHLLFFLWLLLFPIVDAVADYVNSKNRQKNPKVKSSTLVSEPGYFDTSAIFQWIFYIIIAWLLF